MKGKKNAQTPVAPEAEAAMAQLLAGDGDDNQFNYNGLEYDSLGRLVAECTRHGLLVTCYRSDAGDTFNVSLRAGDKRRGYQYYTAQEANSGIAALHKTLSGGLKRVK